MCSHEENEGLELGWPKSLSNSNLLNLLQGQSDQVFEYELNLDILWQTFW